MPSQGVRTPIMMFTIGLAKRHRRHHTCQSGSRRRYHHASHHHWHDDVHRADHHAQSLSTPPPSLSSSTVIFVQHDHVCHAEVTNLRTHRQERQQRPTRYGTSVLPSHFFWPVAFLASPSPAAHRATTSDHQVFRDARNVLNSDVMELCGAYPALTQ